MKRLAVLTAILFYITDLAAYPSSNHLRFRHIDTEEGLSHNGIMTLYQDSRGFIWMGSRDGLNLYNGESIRIYKYDKYDRYGLPDNNIKRITGDDAETIFIQTELGIVSYNIAKDRFKRIFDGRSGAILYNGSLLYSVQGKIFEYDPVSSQENLFYVLQEENALITYMAGGRDSLMIGTKTGLWMKTENEIRNLISGIDVRYIFRDSYGTWWICSYNGEGLFSVHNGEVRQYLHSKTDRNSLSHNQTNTCGEDERGNIWVGTFDGLCVLDRETGKFTSYFHTGRNGSITDSSIWSIITDRQGTVWAGTYYGGVNYFSPTRPDFSKYEAGIVEKECLSSPIVGQITEDRNNNLWICTEGGGLCRYDPENLEFKWYRHMHGKNSISNDNAKCVLYDERRNCIWVGTHLGGLNRLDLDTGTFSAYGREEYENLPSDIVMSITQYDSKLILGTLRGIVLFDPDTGNMTPLMTGIDKAVIPDYILYTIMDSSRRLWIISDSGSRLSSYDLRTGSLKDYPEASGEGAGMEGIVINSVYEDSERRIWVCTNGNGLNLLQEDKTTNFDNASCGLASNVVYMIRELAQDKYIVTTDNGVSIFDWQNTSFSNYRRNEDIPLSSISENSLYITNDSEIFVGGMDGMISFSEEVLGSESNGEFGIYPYSLTIDGTETKPSASEILAQDISLTKTINLKYSQNTFAIKYTTTDYLSNNKNRLEYRLHGYSEEWIQLERENHIVYSKLKPGKYVLTVRSADKDSRFPKEHSINIRVSPPFYSSFWAYCLYITAIIVLTAVIIRTQNNRLKMTEQINYEKRHAEDIEKLNQEKLQFFTNISHEFRTPVSVINGQVRLLMDKYMMNTQLYSSLSRIYRSCTHLDDLVSELLEFRKLDRGFLSIKVKSQDFVEYIRSFYVQYEKIAKARGIRFIFNKSHDRIDLMFDGKQMYKVVNNLLSNAFKYVNDGGTVTMSVRKGNGEAILEVSNTGSIIKQDDLNRIFNRFYQTENSRPGTGIGLHLAKGIVEKHHGKIEAYSNCQDNETTFCVHLPSGNDVFSEEETATGELEAEVYMEMPHIDADEDNAGTQEVPTEDKEYNVLVVEDDAELREMLVELFRPFYNVNEAADGKTGYEMAREGKPDLVVCDISMPGMSGIELCKLIKKSQETNNIPILLLSANDGKEQIISAFQAGADAFFKKPFDINILIARCHNLVSNKSSRQPLQRARIENSSLATNIQEQEFLNKAKETVLGHLDDNEFDANVFARALGVSRTLLFTRLKSIAGKTPRDFISDIRMERAASMLANNPELSITEIAERTGFRSLKYFRKCFKEKFGIAPSEYRG